MHTGLLLCTFFSLFPKSITDCSSFKCSCRNVCEKQEERRPLTKGVNSLVWPDLNLSTCTSFNLDVDKHLNKHVHIKCSKCTPILPHVVINYKRWNVRCGSAFSINTRRHCCQCPSYNPQTHITRADSRKPLCCTSLNNWSASLFSVSPWSISVDVCICLPPGPTAPLAQFISTQKPLCDG